VAYVDVVTSGGGRGYVAVRRAFGAAVVLGDPVCAAADRDDVVDRVVQALPGATLFFQVGDDVARRLRERHGLTTTSLGVEPVVDVASFSLRGRHRQALRSALNHAARRGLEIVEVPPDHLDDAPARRWHRTRRRRRLGFIVPPLRLPGVDGLPGTGRRAFVARQGTETLGFVIFDPLHDDGRVVGWTPSVSCGSMRFRPGLWYALVTRAIERFRDEGVAVVNLGLAPLASPPTTTSPTSLLGRFFPVLRRLGLLYNFRGVEHAKRRFGGTPRPAFLAHRGPLPLRSLLALWWLVARG
jgi:phosphatidylglycerol lysyltransferase